MHGWKFAFLTAAHPDASFTALWSLSFLWGVPVCAAAAGMHPSHCFVSICAFSSDAELLSTDVVGISCLTEPDSAGLVPQLGLAGKYRAAAGALVPGLTMTVTALFSMLNYPTGTKNPQEVRFKSSSAVYFHPQCSRI